MPTNPQERAKMLKEIVHLLESSDGAIHATQKTINAMQKFENDLQDSMRRHSKVLLAVPAVDPKASAGFNTLAKAEWAEEQAVSDSLAEKMTIAETVRKAALTQLGKVSHVKSDAQIDEVFNAPGVKHSLKDDVLKTLTYDAQATEVEQSKLVDYRVQTIRQK